ncbi:hypothetical protein M2432_004106 [Mycobacterium sp. OTB74]|jgi:hypothetical protein|nr:hypothetical protein [Mycobacterium sp. OTB74]
MRIAADNTTFKATGMAEGLGAKLVPVLVPVENIVD